MNEKHVPLNLQKFIISIVLVGVILVVGIFILATLSTSFKVDVTSAGTNTNETLTAVSNVTASSFAILTTDASSGCVVSTVENASNGAVLTSDNYTLPSSCTILAASDSSCLNYDWNVTYTYSYVTATATDSSNASDSMVTALSYGTSWISILVVVGFAVIVLSMLTNGLGAASREEEQVPYY